MIMRRYDVLVRPDEYAQSVKEMAEKAIDDHEWTHRDITQEHFPMNSRVLDSKDYVQFWLTLFDEEVLSNQEILAEMERNGLLPARLKDLLIFGYKYPDKQIDCPIYAIGSVWENRVPFLGISGVTPPISNGRRGLSLTEYDCGWEPRDAFLAIKLVSAEEEAAVVL